MTELTITDKLQNLNNDIEDIFITKPSFYDQCKVFVMPIVHLVSDFDVFACVVFRMICVGCPFT